jgi:hypothetical protein
VPKSRFRKCDEREIAGQGFAINECEDPVVGAEIDIEASSLQEVAYEEKQDWTW